MAPRLRALVVDDHSMIREYVSTILQELNVTVDAVEDGASATRLMRGLQYDLAFLDLALPGLSGTELLRLISNGKVLRPRATAIMSAALNLAGLPAEDLPQLGELLPKPFGSADVVGFVERARERAAASSRPASRPVVIVGGGLWAQSLFEACQRRCLSVTAAFTSADALRALSRLDGVVLVAGPPLDAGSLVGLVASVRERGGATALVALSGTDESLAGDLLQLSAARVVALPRDQMFLTTETIGMAGAPFRQRPRVALQTTAWLRRRPAGTLLAAVCDVSEGGLGLCLQNPPNADEALQVEVEIPGMPHPLEAAAYVAWVGPPAENGVARLGLQFTDISDDAIAQIRGYVHGGVSPPLSL